MIIQNIRIAIFEEGERVNTAKAREILTSCAISFQENKASQYWDIITCRYPLKNIRRIK